MMRSIPDAPNTPAQSDRFAGAGFTGDQAEAGADFGLARVLKRELVGVSLVKSLATPARRNQSIYPYWQTFRD